MTGPEISAIVCFVQLGENPSPLLLEVASQALRGIPNAELKLITDMPQLWGAFPGKIVEYRIEDRQQSVSNLESRFPVISSRAGGYWLKTLERIFVLRHAYLGEPPELPMIHLESDVWSFVDESILSVLRKNCESVAVPATKLGEGCASILYTPNLSVLDTALGRLIEILVAETEWLGDMELLGRGLLEGTLTELPTRPDNCWNGQDNEDGSEFHVIFDASALGQYVCGVDPVHSGNRVVSGHENVDFEVPLNSFTWSAIQVGSSIGKALAVTQNGKMFRVANLHVHSKASPGNICDRSSDWQRLLSEANGESRREIGPHTPELIHSKPPTLRARVQLAYIEGIPATLKRIRRKLDW